MIPDGLLAISSCSILGLLIIERYGVFRFIAGVCIIVSFAF